MGHVALYRQFRPVTFDEIVEQKHAVAALRQSVISGQIGHAYLFCGTRGTGKTSIAKIFSRAINCLAPRGGNPCNECEICRGILDNTLMDVIEMDAASNNSVDNIRRVCDEVMYLPSRAKYKVYIIDEVHMLSGGAFNALLKTLEEPPSHAVFLLATTEPHRIPATIISRCQRYDFRRIPMESMVLRLQAIADVQKVSIDQEALVTISNLSDGALRDAISLLDQVITGADRKITRDDVLRITGVVDDSFLYEMANALLSRDAPNIVLLTEQLIMDGRDMIRFTLDLAHYFRDLMVIRVTANPKNLVQATSDSLIQMKSLAERTPDETLVYAVTRLSGLVSELKWSPDMRTSFEIALLGFGAEIPREAFFDKKPQVTVKKVPISVAGSASTSAEPVAADDILQITTELIHSENVPSIPQVPQNRQYMTPPPIEDIFRAIPPDADAAVTEQIHAGDPVRPNTSSLWAALLHEWEDTLFSDVLQLKHATVFDRDKVFYIVFPDHMQAYAKSLTGREDYKKISKDIMKVFSGNSSVEVHTESERSGQPSVLHSKKAEESGSTAQPDWVAQMLAFSEAAGIPVETMDNSQTAIGEFIINAP